MLSLNKASPKLKAYGEEAKGLVPVMDSIAREMLTQDDQVTLAVLQVTKELRACYGCVFGPDRGDARDLGTHCRRLCTLWVNLELQQEHRFAVKPKLHLFQELCELEDGSPARHATYRDEETGGSIVALGRRRGGPHTPSSVGTQALLKFSAKYRMPNL